MTHIQGYFRDGKYIGPHEDKRTKKVDGPKQIKIDHIVPVKGKAPSQQGLPFETAKVVKAPGTPKKPEPSKGLFDFIGDDLGAASYGKPMKWWESMDSKGSNWKAPAKPVLPEAKPHPKANDFGKEVQIDWPSKASPKASWTDPEQVATWTPGSETPAELHGVAFAPWEDHPTTYDDWNEVEGQMDDLDEPDFEASKEPAAGVIIEEDDGRVWVIHPTNRFGGYKATFPKGHLDKEMYSLQASAIKEAFEESGLKVEITGFVMDVERTTTTARYYSAKRVGGTPSDMGWESQAVSLVPKEKLYEALNRYTDHPIAEAIGAGPAPKPKEWPKWEPKASDPGDELPF